MLSAKDSGTFLLGGDLPIHRLGFGAMRLTGPGIWGEPKNSKEAQAVLKRALELGVNFIDTADSYGPEVSENQIALALYPYPKDLVIATKGGLTRSGPSAWAPVGRQEYLRQCVEMSLRRLKLECIDLYQLHKIDPRVPFEESLEALGDLQKKGKIRFIGLSNVSVPEIKRARDIVNVVSVQNLYNLSDRSAEPVLEFCEANNLAFIPWYPIGSGELVRKGTPLDSLANQKGVTPAQLALAWLLKRSPVILPIPGTSTVAHLDENIAAASVHITEAEFTQLSKLAV